MSSMGEFFSLRDYGRALRRSEGPVYHFYWSEDGQTLSWDGQTYLTMTQFRGLAHEALSQASAHCKRLMYDWDPDYLDLADIRDRLSNATNGYSFVSDPANKLEDAYLELFMRVCISPVDGLLQKRGKDQSSWDVKAARAYLNAHDDLLRCLMALFQFDWGQACRISELLTLECYNTASRLRGICVYGAKLCAITRSHKARLTTNNEFQVARFFSPAVSRLVYQYLVYIRPTAHALLRKCFHATPRGVLLFAPLHRQATWTTKTFTDELRRLSRSVPGISFQIGAQLYRQISIAITERHVRQAAPFNRSDDTSSTAGEDIAFAWQSGHRPLQRHTTYGLDGAFPDQLQPALLKIYAKLSAEWQAFLHIDEQPNLNSTTRNVSSHGNDSNDHVYSTENIEPLSNRKRPNVGINQAVTAHLQKKRKAGQDTQENHSCSVGSAALDETTIHIPDHVMENTDDYQTVDDYPASTTRSRDPSDTASDQNFPSIGPFAYLEEWSLAICKEFIKAIPGVIKNQAELEKWEPPSPTIERIPYISPPKDDDYYKVEYGFVGGCKRGRYAGRITITEKLWREGVRYQRLFRSQAKSGFIEVERGIEVREDKDQPQEGID
ncbi:uncharacterized protein FFB20_12479 [Fusarium fujikuroi]|nr:uncharacterized protein FFB20_12479 [Fusarium fujikuroi]